MIFVFCLLSVWTAGADDEAWNQQSIDGHLFNFSVSDYKWRTVGTVAGASSEISAVKGLAIRYSMADSETEKRLSPQTASRLTLDAVKKCSELGEFEQLEQQKQFPADMKVKIQAQVMTSVIYDSVGNAGFSCTLSLSAKRN